MASHLRPHKANPRRCRRMAMAMDTGMDGPIRWIEARRRRGGVLRDYIRRYLCDLWDYLRNQRRRLAAEGADTIGRRTGIRIGIGIGTESVGGIENEGDMEGQPQEARMDTEEMVLTVAGSAGVYRIHRVR